VFLAEKGMHIPTCEIDLRKGEQFSPTFRAINPRCVVPYLVLDDGTGIAEAAVICRYLEEIKPEPSLIGESPQERALVNMWDRRVETDGFDAVAEVLRNTSPAFKDRALTGSVDVAQIPELGERGRVRTRCFFEDLNARLGEVEYVAGPRFTIADITALVVVEFAGWIKEDIGEHHGDLRRWYDTVSARPSMRA
jgi:glutathione S-transferase